MKIALEAKQRAAKHFKGIENDKNIDVSNKYLDEIYAKESSVRNMLLCKHKFKWYCKCWCC